MTRRRRARKWKGLWSKVDAQAAGVPDNQIESLVLAVKHSKRVCELPIRLLREQWESFEATNRGVKMRRKRCMAMTAPVGWCEALAVGVSVVTGAPQCQVHLDGEVVLFRRGGLSSWYRSVQQEQP